MDVEILCHFLASAGCVLNTRCRVGSHTWCSPGSSGLFWGLFPVPPTGNPRQKSQLSGFGSCWLAGIDWLVALETTPVIPDAKSHRGISEIPINHSASFPPFIVLVSSDWTYPNPFIQQYSGTPSQVVFLGKGCTGLLRAQFGPWQSDADSLNPLFFFFFPFYLFFNFIFSSIKMKQRNTNAMKY